MMGPGNTDKSMVSRYFWLIHEPNIENLRDCCINFDFKLSLQLNVGTLSRILPRGYLRILKHTYTFFITLTLLLQKIFN